MPNVTYLPCDVDQAETKPRRAEPTGATIYLHVNADTEITAVYEVRGGEPEYRIRLSDPSQLGVTMSLIMSEAELLRVCRAATEARA